VYFLAVVRIFVACPVLIYRQICSPSAKHVSSNQTTLHLILHTYGKYADVQEAGVELRPAVLTVFVKSLLVDYMQDAVVVLPKEIHEIVVRVK
jgi:hypothetical protein